MMAQCLQKVKVGNQCADLSKSKVTICPATTHILNVVQHPNQAMPIKRCKDQSFSNQTLNEFYEDIQRNENSIENSIGVNMLKLIEKLNGLFEKSEIYALTSLYDLVLLSENTWKSKWVLKLITNGTDHVIYEADKKTNEFNKRTVYSSRSDYTNKILELMIESGYWNDIPELK